MAGSSDVAKADLTGGKAARRSFGAAEPRQAWFQGQLRNVGRANPGWGGGDFAPGQEVSVGAGMTGGREVQDRGGRVAAWVCGKGGRRQVRPRGRELAGAWGRRSRWKSRTGAGRGTEFCRLQMVHGGGGEAAYCPLI